MGLRSSSCDPASGLAVPVRSDAHGYWAAVLHLLLYSFGWTRPEEGVQWWLDGGRTTKDRRFQLFEHVWAEDNGIETFGAWMLSSVPFMTDAVAPLIRLAGREAEAQQEVEQSSVFGEPRAEFSGGSDSLHLTMHASGPTRFGCEAELIASSPTERRAVLVADSMSGWYRALNERGNALPDLGDRSWHVDVVVKTSGWLGTFRRSRETGLWFSGKHRWHVVGN